MSIELISVLVAVLAIGATLAGLILTSNRRLRKDINDLRGKVVVVVSLCSVALAGCSADKSVSQPTKEQVEATADCPPNCSDDAQTVKEEFFHAEARAIPDDVSYSIIDSTAIAGIKRSLDVRLNKRVAEDTLHAIALKLKSQDSRDYDRTFIVYYLPDMTVGAGAWATTHFTPELEVKILGLSTEEEKKFSAVPANREIVGQWLDEIPYASSRITIFHEGGKLYVEQMFADGSSHKKELVEKRSPLGRRFDQVDAATAGDHWILDSRGNLQLHDNDGLIRTAKR